MKTINLCLCKTNSGHIVIEAKDFDSNIVNEVVLEDDSTAKIIKELQIKESDEVYSFISAMCEQNYFKKIKSIKTFLKQKDWRA